MRRAPLEFAGSAPLPEAVAGGLHTEAATREAPSARRASGDAERTTALRLPETPEAGQGAVPRPRSAPDAEATAVLPAERRADAGQTSVLPTGRHADAGGVPGPRARAGDADGDPAGRTDVLPPVAETRALPEAGALPEAHVLPETQALPENRPLPGARPPSPLPTTAKPGALPEPVPAVAGNPWQGAGPAGAAEHTHDPHEVTVQLDAVQLGDGRLVRVAPEMPGGTPEGSDGPVFVDETGRRVRRFRRLGIAVGLACAAYAVVMVATLLSGSSEAPWLPVRDPKAEPPAGQADPAPLPSRSALPSASATPAAGESAPPAADAATPAPGSGTTAPGAVPALPQPDGTPVPEPAPTRTAPEPGGSATEPGPTGTGGQPSAGTPDLFPTPGGGLPTGPGKDKGKGNDTFPGGGTPAGGPNDRAMGAPAASAPSPEYLL